MNFNLISASEDQKTLHPFELLDSSLIPAPTKKYASALYFAWAWDWALALGLTAGMVASWESFIEPLVLDHLSVFAEATFFKTSKYAFMLVAPLVHFALSFMGLNNCGQTFGMRIFNHVVTEEQESLSWQKAMLWAAGSTVSALVVGVSTFWLEELTQSTSMTQEYHHWKFSRPVNHVVQAPVNLVELAEENSSQPFEEKQAA